MVARVHDVAALAIKVRATPQRCSIGEGSRPLFLQRRMCVGAARGARPLPSRVHELQEFPFAAGRKGSRGCAHLGTSVVWRMSKGGGGSQG